MPHPRAPVVRAQVEPLVPEVGHGGRAVGGHDALGIRAVVGGGGGFGRFAVAAQVEQDERVVGEEVGGYEVPD